MNIIKEIEGDQITLYVSDEMKFDDRTAFWEVQKEFMQPEFRTLVINMERLNFIDSAGVALLLNANDQLTGTNKKIILKHPQGQVNQVFRMSKFDDLFTVIHPA